MVLSEDRDVRCKQSYREGHSPAMSRAEDHGGRRTSLQRGGGRTHRHTALGANLGTNLHLAMQVDHTQVDEGEDLHRQARCAGVPVGEHFGVLIQRTAVEQFNRELHLCLSRLKGGSNESRKTLQTCSPRRCSYKCLQGFGWRWPSIC